MADLSRGDIAHLAKLTRLELSEEQFERYATQLTSVVGYVEQLSEVDTSAIFPLHGSTGTSNVLAADSEGGAPFDRELALQALPRRDGDFIEVRAVLGGEVEAA